MKLDSKKILTIGAGAVVGYLLFCKVMKKDAEKSLEGGAIGEEASAEEGGISGGGGGGFGGGGGGGFLPVPPPAVIVNNTPYTPQSGVPMYNASQYTNTPQNPTGAPAPTTTASTTTSRETPPTPPPVISKPPIVDVSGAPVSAVPKPSKFTDFDGNANFQDLLL